MLEAKIELMWIDATFLRIIYLGFHKTMNIRYIVYQYRLIVQIEYMA